MSPLLVRGVRISIIPPKGTFTCKGIELGISDSGHKVHWRLGAYQDDRILGDGIPVNVGDTLVISVDGLTIYQKVIEDIKNCTKKDGKYNIPSDRLFLPELNNKETKFIPYLPDHVFECLLERFEEKYGKYPKKNPGFGFSRNSSTGSGKYQSYFVGIGLVDFDFSHYNEFYDKTGFECTYCFNGLKMEYIVTHSLYTSTTNKFLKLNKKIHHLGGDIENIMEILRGFTENSEHTLYMVSSHGKDIVMNLHKKTDQKYIIDTVVSAGPWEGSLLQTEFNTEENAKDYLSFRLRC